MERFFEKSNSGEEEAGKKEKVFDRLAEINDPSDDEKPQLAKRHNSADRIRVKKGEKHIRPRGSPMRKRKDLEKEKKRVASISKKRHKEIYIKNLRGQLGQCFRPQSLKKYQWNCLRVISHQNKLDDVLKYKVALIDLKQSNDDPAQVEEVPKDMSEVLKFVSSMNLEQIQSLFFQTKQSD